MSKKQDRSSRKADLPDWADEVTPADEVMEKFYAPTGLFRPGPISISRESPEAPPAPQNEYREKINEKQLPSEVDKESSHISAEDLPPREAAPAPSSEVRVTYLPLPNGPEESPEGSEPTSQPEAEASPKLEAGVPSGATPADSQQILFTEFADRWKKYLYPGQLAVMRTLYELTFPHGTSECFTRYSALAASTKMSRRNCINVMNSLVDRGFVERLEIRNDATGKGIKLRIHLDPLR